MFIFSKTEADSESGFTGIQNNSSFAQAIERSFKAQTAMLSRTVADEDDVSLL
jgi:hypothetical protein